MTATPPPNLLDALALQNQRIHPAALDFIQAVEDLPTTTILTFPELGAQLPEVAKQVDPRGLYTRTVKFGNHPALHNTHSEYEIYANLVSGEYGVRHWFVVSTDDRGRTPAGARRIDENFTLADFENFLGEFDSYELSRTRLAVLHQAVTYLVAQQQAQAQAAA